MTKAIWILIIIVVGYVGFRVLKAWNETKTAQSNPTAEPAVQSQVDGERLPGLPPQLESGLRAAKSAGHKTFLTWFRTNEKLISDPRKAWIELELCTALFRDNPAEARKIFTGVKDRVPSSSPVWPRVQELQKTFE